MGNKSCSHDYRFEGFMCQDASGKFPAKYTCSKCGAIKLHRPTRVPNCDTCQHLKKFLWFRRCSALNNLPVKYVYGWVDCFRKYNGI